MGFSREKMRQIVELMALAAAFGLAVLYSDKVGAGIALFVSVLKPFLLGGAIAFVLNLPLRMFETTIFKNWNHPARRPVSLLLSFVLVVLILTLVIVMIVPQLVTAVTDFVQQVPIAINNLIRWLNKLSTQYPEVFGALSSDPTAFLTDLQSNWQDIVQNVLDFLQKGFGSFLTTTIDFTKTLISALTNGLIGLIFSFYILAQKEKLTNQARRVATAYLPQKAADWVLRLCSLLYKNFSSFVTGQCIEAVILGTMFAVSMSILRMPYAVMVGVLIAFTALIPIVGAFIGCVVGAFLILLKDPMQALAFVVLFFVLQQIEGNLIYPRVVGSSVGLPSLWVLVAVTVGGSLFGVPGMLLFIPLASTAYTLLREDVNARNAKKAAAQWPVPPREEPGGVQTVSASPAPPQATPEAPQPESKTSPRT